MADTQGSPAVPRSRLSKFSQSISRRTKRSDSSVSPGRVEEIINIFEQTDPESPSESASPLSQSEVNLSPAQKKKYRNTVGASNSAKRSSGSCSTLTELFIPPDSTTTDKKEKTEDISTEMDSKLSSERKKDRRSLKRKSKLTPEQKKKSNKSPEEKNKSSLRKRKKKKEKALEEASSSTDELKAKQEPDQEIEEKQQHEKQEEDKEEEIEEKKEKEEEKSVVWKRGAEAEAIRLLIKKKLDQEEERIEKDTGKEYGSSVFFLPTFPRIVVYSGKKNSYQIQSASIYKLVETLTTPVGTEHVAFMKVFFMTYRSFTNGDTVLDLIIKRFKGPDPEELSEEENKKLEAVLKVAREGVCKSLVHWFNNHYRDFSGKPLAKKLENFINNAVETQPPSKENLVGYLQKMYQKKTGKGTYTSLFDSGIMVEKSNCPDPILPKEWNASISFLDLDELEIARQLTITEHHIYAEIQPVELQELAWSKPKLKHLAPRLLEMVSEFNRISNAASALILHVPKLKARKKAVEKLVAIAEHLLNMNSFNMAMAIFSAFQNAAVHRLHHTFDSINKRTNESMERFKVLLSSAQAYKTYRDHLNSVAPPCIPFLGVFLTDLTFIDEGNPKIVKGLVNFRKKELEYGVIVQVLRYQTHAYQYTLVPQFSGIFQKLPAMTEDEMYAASLQIEPRKAKRKEIK